MSKNYMNDSQASEIVKYISDTMKLPIMGAGGGFAPIGTINFFDASIAPQGWLACDGQTYNIIDYPELASFYASVHGASNFYGGNGTTTFAVPDLRGEFLRGAGTNSHTNQGSGGDVGEHQDGTEHTAGWFNNIEGGWDFTEGTSTTSYLNLYKKADKRINSSRASSAYTSSLKRQANTSGSGVWFTSRPTNTSFLICVKATLSDAEISAFNVYTPREHQVGWWEEEIDGVLKRKPVYEKTFSGGALSTGVTVIDTLDNVERITKSNHCIYNKLNQAFSEYSLSNNTFAVFLDGTSVKIHIGTGWTGNDAITSYNVTFRYTKTTDQWQTS